MVKDNVYITTDVGEFACRNEWYIIKEIEDFNSNKCEVIEHKKLIDYPNLYLKNKHGGLIPFSELKEVEVYAIKSHIYKNIFYPIQYFDQMYREDLFGVMGAIALRLGAKEIELKYLQEQNIAIKENIQENGKTSANFKNCNLQAEGTQKNSKDFHSKEKWKIHNKQEDLKNKRWGKEELAEYINKEHISIDVLPLIFRENLKKYLDDGEITGTIENREKMAKFVKDNAKRNKELKAKLDAQKIIGINLQLNSDCSVQEENSFTSEIMYRIKF